MVVNVLVVNNVQLLLMRVGTDCLNFFQGEGYGLCGAGQEGSRLISSQK